MPIFDKNIIESFADRVSDEVVDNTWSILTFIVENTIKEIKKNNPYINDNYQILPVNEFFNGAILPNSKLCVLLALNSPQLELNTVKLVKNKFKGFFLRLKNVWQDVKHNKKKKKRKEKQKEQVLTVQNKDNYNILNFCLDFFNLSSKFITQKSIVELNKGRVKFSGEDIPFQIEIIPVINKSDSYNYYVLNKNKFFNIDFKDREKNLQLMIDQLSDDYISLCQIYEMLYFNIYGKIPNAIFIESLVANLPQNILKENKGIYNKFIFSCNYLVNLKVAKLFSITNPNIKIFEEPLCNISLLEINNFMKDLRKFL